MFTDSNLLCKAPLLPDLIEAGSSIDSGRRAVDQRQSVLPVKTAVFQVWMV